LASRQVTLLTHGYLSGRLKFEYNNPYSRARERFILNEIEKELIGDALSKRLLLDAQIIQLNPKSTKLVYSQADKYMQLRLPYLGKQIKINDKALKPITNDEIEYWKNLRKERETAKKDG